MPESRRSRALRVAASVADALHDAQRDSVLSVGQLARMADISRAQLFKYWSGDAAMPLWVAVALADALGVNLPTVLRRAGR